MTNFANILRSLLQFEPDRTVALRKVKDILLTRFHADTVTIHRLDSGRGVLTLVAEEGIPAPLIPVIREIPLGKGIAGEAAQSKKPVTMCNLQTDSSGVAKPGAKQTGVGGALCVPILAQDDAGDEHVVGTVGVGTRREYTFDENQTRDLLNGGRALAEYIDALPVSGH